MTYYILGFSSFVLTTAAAFLLPMGYYSADLKRIQSGTRIDGRRQDDDTKDSITSSLDLLVKLCKLSSKLNCKHELMHAVPR